MAEDRKADESVVLSDGRRVAFQAEVARQLPQLDEDERQELALALQRVAEALRPVRIYVFGSYALGTAVRGVSDVLMALRPLPDSLFPAGGSPARRPLPISVLRLS